MRRHPNGNQITNSLLGKTWQPPRMEPQEIAPFTLGKRWGRYRKAPQDSTEALCKLGAVLLKLLPATQCRICNKTFEEPQVTNCGHTFCAACVARLLSGALSNGDVFNCSCPVCGQLVHAGLVSQDMNMSQICKVLKENDVQAKVIDVDEEMKESIE